MRAREWFSVAAESAAGDGRAATVAFFEITDEGDEDAQEWARGFSDGRLAAFGALGYGWVLWLEGGRLVDVEPYAGGREGSADAIVVRTRRLWP